MSISGQQQDITGILGKACGGDRAAFDQLFQVIYEDLKKIARSAEWDRERNPTLNATAIVSELCLRWLSGGLPQLDAANRRTLFATVAKAVQDMLVDHARRRAAQRRGGHLQRVPLAEDGAEAAETPSVIIEEKLDHEALAAALERLRAESPRQHEVVMLRFYAGQDYEQIGQMLGVNEKTARRDWRAARAFLNSELADG